MSRSTQESKPAFSNHGFSDSIAEQERQYRSVSRLAIVAFLLCLATPLALIHPAAWAIPFATIPVAWQAIRQIAKPHSLLTGRTVACFALFVAVVFATWAPSHYLIQRRFLSQQARQFADTWVSLVCGNHLQEAYRWMLPYDERMDGMPTQEFYEEYVMLQDGLKSTFTKEPASLLSGQPDSSVKFLSVDSIHKVPSARERLVVLTYVLERSDAEDVKGIQFLIQVREAIDEDGARHWQVDEIFKPA